MVLLINAVSNGYQRFGFIEVDQTILKADIASENPFPIILTFILESIFFFKKNDIKNANIIIENTEYKRTE